MEAVKFLDAETNAEFAGYLSRTYPTDHIHLGTEDLNALDALWRNENGVTNKTIPADLFFSGNVALCDCKIIKDEPDVSSFAYRVTVFPDYQERIKKAKGQAVCVAVVSREITNGAGYFILILVKKGVDCLAIGPLGNLNVNTFGLLREAWGDRSLSHFAGTAYWFLSCWYGIQIALLHPIVKDVFAHPIKERAYSDEPNKGGGKRRVVRYVKKHVVNAEEIIKRLTSDDGKFTRHTFCWYVIGHWRKYRNGKKIFIQPYWKGALRHLKEDKDGRDREIVMEGVKA